MRLAVPEESTGSDRRWHERSWEGSTATDLAGAWTWTVPLVAEGMTLGELTVTRSVTGARSRYEMAERLDALAADVTAALLRLRERTDTEEGQAHRAS